MIPNSVSRVTTFAALFLISALSLMYLYFGFKAGMWGDDIILYLKFHLRTLDNPFSFTTNNFGRYTTRLLYWSILPKLFGPHHFPYYLFNYLNILISAVLFARIIMLTHKGALLFWLALLLYLTLPTTFLAYTWLAAYQHTGAHLFYLLFIYLCVRDLSDAPNGKAIALVLLIYVLGIFSNQLFVTAPVGAMLIRFSLKRQFDRWQYMVLVFLGLSCAFTIISKAAFGAKRAYANSYDPELLINNLCIFSKTSYANSWVLLIVPAAIFLYCLARRMWTGLALIVTAFVAYLPFAFLALRHDPYFSHLLIVFFSGAVLYLSMSFKPGWLKLTAPVYIFCVFSVFWGTYIHALTAPRGAAERHALATVHQQVTGSNNRICITETVSDLKTKQRMRFRFNDYTYFEVFDPVNQYQLTSIDQCIAQHFDYHLNLNAKGRFITASVNKL